MTQRSLLWRSLQVFARIWTTLWFDLKVYGKENVPRRGGALLAANHQSFLDPVLVAVKLDRPVSFFARSGLFENPYFGWLIRSLHAFPVKQGKSDKGAIEETIRRLSEGHILNIYPEGSRTEDGEIGKIERGISLIVRRAKVPIVPVVIDGSFQAWPFWKKLFRAHPIRVMYGKPMDVLDLKGDEIVRLIDRTLRSMQQELRAMDRLEKESRRGTHQHAR